MGKKSDNLEALVKEDFSKLSFYSQNDTLEVKPDCDNKSIYDLEYDAIHSCEDGSNVYYFNCCITIDLIERNAVWKNVRLNDEYHGKGWGGELIRAGESLFKKLGIQTAYVDTNVNKPFWESRGYKASFKILDNKGKKNFYQHVYETISSMSFYKGEDITISHDNKKCFFASYSS